VLSKLNKLGGLALDLFFPKHCIGCGKNGEFLCQSCISTLSKLNPPVCPLCGRPQASGILCPSCVNWQAAIDGIRSPFCFENTVRKTVIEFKYRNLRAAAPLMASLMNDYIKRSSFVFDVVVPVPLHPARLKWRGYNQSALLALELGKLTGVPVIEDSAVRVKPTLPQAKTASVIERRKNVAGAFACRNDGLKGKYVLLIDDVSTSGATMDACAQALKSGGAESVWGLCFAREI
jgi:competence protein ComFC